MQYEVEHWQRLMGFKDTGCFSQLVVAFLFILSCSCSWLAEYQVALVTYQIQLGSWLISLKELRWKEIFSYEWAWRARDREVISWSISCRGKCIFWRTWVGMKGLETLMSSSFARMRRIKIVEMKWRLLCTDFLWSVFVCSLCSDWKR